MSRLKAIAGSVLALSVLAWAGTTLRAEEPAALCCVFTSDCVTTEFPICYMTNVDCNPTISGNQGYCMAKQQDN